MPYLSHNYRYQPRPRYKNLVESGLFVVFSTVAIFVVLFAMGWFSAYAAEAATGINQQINYQGKLLDTNSNQVANGSWNFKFEIYDASSGGNLLWTERWTSTTTQVTTVNGVFSAALGSLSQTDSLSSVNWNSDSLYLQVTLDADANGSWEESFATRKRFSSASYAFNADMVDGFHATSTAAVASYLPAYDSTKTLNLFTGGVSSTRATTSAFVLIGHDGAINNLDRANGDLYVMGDSEFDGTVYFQGAVVSSNAPTLPHAFGAWATGVANSNVSNSVIYINPASAVTDSNLLGLAVNNSVQFIVDAEGDVFANTLTLAGSQSVGTSNISTLIVENNSYLGDAPNSDWTHIQGSAWIQTNKSNTASSTALVITQQGTGNYLEISNGATYYNDGTRYFTITNAGVASTTQLFVQNAATSTNYLVVGSSTGSVNNLDYSGGDLYVQDGLEVDGQLFGTTGRLSVLNATTTNIGTLLTYTGATLNGLTTATDLRPSTLNATTTNVGTLTAFGTGNIFTNDVRMGTINATTTNVGTLTIYTSSVFNGLSTFTDLRATSLNATSTNVGTLNGYGLATFSDLRPSTLNATTTNVGTLNLFSELRTPLIHASSTDFDLLNVYGNATTTGWFNVGTTDVVGTLGSLFGAGDLFVGRNATTTGNLSVGGFASTTNLILANGASNLTPYYDLYVSGGELYYDGTQITGGGGLTQSAWKATSTDKIGTTLQGARPYLTPTSSDSLYLSSDLVVDDNLNVYGNATTSGWFNIGTSNVVSLLGTKIGAGDLFVGRNATTTGNLTVASSTAMTTGPGPGLFVDAYNSRLGIGTTAPTVQLEVSKSSSGALGPELALVNTGGGVGDIEAITFSSLTYGDKRAQIQSTVEGSPYYGTLEFLTGKTTPTEKMRITGVGNVGIGDTSPLSLFTVGSGDKFQVSGAGNATTSGWFNIGTTDVVGTLFATIGAGDLFVGSDATITNGLIVDGGTLFVDAQGNRVGIGTTTPNALIDPSADGVLQVSGTIQPQLVLQRTGGYSQQANYLTDGAGLYLTVAGAAAATNNNIIFRTGRTNASYAVTEAMRITNDGNVRIPMINATTSNIGTLKVFTGTTLTGLATANDFRPSTLNATTTNVGTLTAYGTGNIFTNDVRMGTINATTTNVGTLTIYTSSIFNGLSTFTDLRATSLNATSTNVGTLNVYTGATTTSLYASNDLKVDGNVGIGTTAPAQKLHVVGNIYSSQSILGSPKASMTSFGYTNFAPNPSFEYDDAAAITPTGWTLELGSVQVVNDGANMPATHLGANALYFPTGAYDRVISNYAFPVTAGQKLYGTLKYRGTAAAGGLLYFGIFWSDGTYTYFCGAQDGTATYATCSGTVTVAAGVTNGRVWIFNFSGNTDDIYVDDVYVSNQNATLYNNFFVNSTNVGIGTTAPSNVLEVSGDTKLSGNASTTGNFSIGTTNPVATLGSLFGAGDLFVSSDATITTGLIVDAGTLFVDAQGNRVGIGTTAPNSTLEVSGDTKFSGNASTTGWFSIGTTNPVATLGSLFGAGDLFVGSDATITTGLIVDAGTLFVDAKDNRVGIGTASPISPLHVGATLHANDVNNTIAKEIIVGSTQSQTNQVMLRLLRETDASQYYPGTVDFNVGAYNAGGAAVNYHATKLTISLKSAGDYNLGATTDVMTLFDNGNVGIGDTTPLALLTVGTNDAFRVDSSGNASTTGNFSIGTTNPVATLGSLFGAGDLFVSSDATITTGLIVDAGTLFVDAQGDRVGIGTTAPNSTLEVSGDTKFSGNASTTGWFSIGTTNPVATLGSLFGAGDLFVGSDATITKGLLVDTSTLFVDAQGDRVGVGTITPQAKFNVLGKIQSGNGTAGTGSTGTLVNYDTVNASVYSVGTSPGMQLWLDTTPTKANRYYTNASGDMLFGVYNGSVWVDTITMLNAGGNLGIGDASPLSLLTVGASDAFRVDNSGNATSSGWFNIGTTSGVANAGSAIGAGDLFVSDDATITDSFYVNSGTLFVDGSESRVAIGSTNTANIDLSIFDADANNTTRLALSTPDTNTANQTIFELFTKDADSDAAYDAGDYGWELTARSQSYTTASEQGQLIWSRRKDTATFQQILTLDGHGLVGINVNPAYALDVATTSVSGALTYAANFFNDGNDADYAGLRVQAGQDASGYTGTTYYLNAFDGDGTQIGYVALVNDVFGVTDVSDARLKKNITDTEINALDIVNQLRVVDFNRLDAPEGTPKITGFLAQEVQQVYPHMVSTGSDGYLGVVKDDLVPVIVKALQQQQAQINLLQSSPTASTTEPLQVITNPDIGVQTLVVQQAATFYGTMYVVGEAGFEHKVVFKDDVEIEGKLYVSADQAGTAMLAAGATSTEVVFGTAYNTVPKVVANLTDGGETQFINWKIINKTSRGFRILVEHPVATPISFDWLALGLNGDGAPPAITDLVVSNQTVGIGIPVELWAKVTDPDTSEQDLTYTWSFSPEIGSLSGTSGLVYWTVDSLETNTPVVVTVHVSDGKNVVDKSTTIQVLGSGQVAGVETTEPTPTVVLGCTDQAATNYSATATTDDGSCAYPTTEPTPVVEQPTPPPTEPTPGPVVENPPDNGQGGLDAPTGGLDTPLGGPDVTASTP